MREITIEVPKDMDNDAFYDMFEEITFVINRYVNQHDYFMWERK